MYISLLIVYIVIDAVIKPNGSNYRFIDYYIPLFTAAAFFFFFVKKKNKKKKGENKIK